MKTVKLSVAKLISENAIVPNHKIMAASEKHPLSGLQRLRELKKDFHAEYPGLTAYNYNNNHYNFTHPFRDYCRELVIQKIENKREEVK